MKSVLVRIFLAAALACALPARAQQRPQMLGFCKMTFLVSSHRMAGEYYGGLLGFDRAFTYGSPLGRVESYKVNDWQFLEFIEDGDAASKNRFVSVAIRTDDADGMRAYLLSQGIAASPVALDGAGNKSFTAEDDRGLTVEFTEWVEGSLHGASRGRFLSDRRISDKIHHVGLHLNGLEAAPRFWVEVLGFTELVRVPEDPALPPALVYYAMPGNTECIEQYSNGEPGLGSGFEHPCFLTYDVQTTLNTLRERDRRGRSYAPGMGRTRRWLINTANPDGTRVEFTEPFPVK